MAGRRGPGVDLADRLAAAADAARESVVQARLTCLEQGALGAAHDDELHG